MVLARFFGTPASSASPARPARRARVRLARVRPGSGPACLVLPSLPSLSSLSSLLTLTALLLMTGCGGSGAGKDSLTQVSQGGGGAPSGSLQVGRPPGSHSSTANTAAPKIVTGPQSQAVADGMPASFDVMATGGAPMTWQWLRDGLPIEGAGASSWTLPMATIADDGARIEVLVRNGAGQVISAPATLTVSPLAPNLGGPPAGRLQVQSGTPLAITVKVLGSRPMSLQWYRDGFAVPGAESNTFSLPAVGPTDHGAIFHLVATNAHGTRSSSQWTLDVTHNPVAPAIMTAPAALTVTEGDPALFSVTANGTGPLRYQWFRNGVPIAGAEGSNHLLPAAALADDGAAFSVVVRNDSGAIASEPARLTVRQGQGLSLLAGHSGTTGDVDGVGVAAAFGAALSLARDATGQIFIADTQTSLIRKLTTDGLVTTLAGVAPTRGLPNIGAVDGSAGQARFRHPAGTAVDGSGNVYVSDTDNHTIRRISPEGVVSTLAGSPGQAGSADGTGAAARFSYPSGLAIDAAGTLYVNDRGNATIRRVTPAGVVTTLTGVAGEQAHVDGPAGVARLYYVRSIAIDGTGTLHVTSSEGRTLRRILPDGTVVTIAGSHLGAPGNVDGQGAAASFNRPAALTSDAAGNVFVVDETAGRIRRITPAGDVTTVFTGPTQATLGGIVADAAGGLIVSDGARLASVTATDRLDVVAGSNPSADACIDGDLATARFGPGALLAAHRSGDLAIVHRIVNGVDQVVRHLSMTDGRVRTVLDRADPACQPDSTAATATLAIAGAAFDAAGNLFLADTHSATILRLATDGGLSVFAGSPGNAAAVDGAGAAARFVQPGALAFDPAGNLWVGDDGATLRRISPAGEVTTVVGQAGDRAIVDGIGTDARLDGVTSLAIDATGTIHVSHSAAHVVRRITPALQVTTLGSVSEAGLVDGEAAAARFGEPASLTPAPDGGALVYDAEYDVLRHIDVDGRVATIAGTADGRIGIRLGALPGRLRRVSGLATGPAGEVYLAMPGSIIRLDRPGD